MRGKAHRIFDPPQDLRITPAYAGKRYKFASFNCTQQDHPRLCGEKNMPGIPATAFPGSPPPMRGKGISAYALVYLSGITPAYAGKSFAFRLGGSGIRDHPRLCGEKSASAFAVRIDSGSPPPMRGKEQVTLCACFVHRITPAYAGKSVKSHLSV